MVFNALYDGLAATTAAGATPPVSSRSLTPSNNSELRPATPEQTGRGHDRTVLLPIIDSDNESSSRTSSATLRSGRKEGTAAGAAGRAESDGVLHRARPDGTEAATESRTGAPSTHEHKGQSAQSTDCRTIRGGVKASFVGVNVDALRVWGGLDAIAGSSLLVDCKTPSQWKAEEFRPTGQVVCVHYLGSTVDR